MGTVDMEEICRVPLQMHNIGRIAGPLTCTPEQAYLGILRLAVLGATDTLVLLAISYWLAGHSTCNPTDAPEHCHFFSHLET